MVPTISKLDERSHLFSRLTDVKAEGMFSFYGLGGIEFTQGVHGRRVRQKMMDEGIDKRFDEIPTVDGRLQFDAFRH